MLASIPSPSSNGFYVGPLFFHFYGLCYVVGITAAVVLTRRLWRAQGGDPATGTTTGGALRRGWLNIKTSITGKSDEAVLNECEKGEDAAVHSYKKALSKDLPEHIRQVVDRQYQGVLRNHDEIKNLRDQVKISA